MQRGDLHLGRLAHVDVVGVVGRQAGVEDQRRPVGNHVQDLLARCDDAADGVHRQPDHLAGGRCADLHAGQLFLEGVQLGQQIVQLVLGIAQVLGHVLLVLGVQPDRLHLGLALRLLGAGGVGGEVGPRSVEARGRPLQGPHAVDRGVALVGQGLGAGKFVVDQLGLLVGGADLVVVALDLFRELGVALTQDRLLADDGADAGAQLGLLLAQGVLGLHLVVTRQLGELARGRDRGLAGGLGQQARALRLKADHLRGHGALGGRDVTGRQFDQHLAGLHMLALLDLDRRDGAPVAVLHRLTVTLHRDLARRIGSGVQAGKRRPSQEQHEEHDHHGAADHQLPARIVVHHLVDRRAGRDRQCGGGGDF